MEKELIYPHIDHTMLKAVSTEADIDKLCEEALRLNTASVCIPPSFIAYARNKFGEKLNICTVIGFPLGYNATAVKVFEAQCAIADGADELDMVVNLGDVKMGRFDKVTAEIAALKKVCGDKVLKVIIETCYLEKLEKIALCDCVTNAKADYIKTSTGFGTDGARLEDIKLFKKHIGENVKMKAAGGVKTKADLEAFLGEGCERIGTSSAVKILSEE
ncbi:MAG: deoxyribose-phosphate aldolase [Oscillospiraceae bacterium]